MTKEIMNAVNTQIFGVWFLIGAALVFWMQAGFAMVEAGFTRAKNAGNIIMKNLMDFCIGTCVFILIGFSLLLGEDMIGLIGKPGFDIFTSYANFDWSSFVFNLVFCATTATIVSGAMAERTKFLSYCIYSAVISALIYPIEAHWIWGGGWLSQMGFHDFAGSCAIHMVGGLSALIGAKFLGPRIGKFTKDKDGNIDDVVLGYDDFRDYQTKDAYLGALVGRTANRIGKGKFTLNSETYTLPINNGPNCLHGGVKGFSYQIFDYQILEDSIEFTYLSKDGEEGYPGNLAFKAIYTLNKDTLIVRYQATSDKDTIINITNHSYFNLSGAKEDIYNHQLLVHSDKYACVDSDGLPTGKFNLVKDTPFDFNSMTRIGDVIDSDDEQLKLGAGYDHPFIFNQDKDQAILYHEATGRKLTVSTSLPGAQIYSANYLDGRIGKYGIVYPRRFALCIETQNLPDAINIEEDPTTILKKGEVYDEITSYKFEVIK